LLADVLERGPLALGRVRRGEGDGGETVAVREVGDALDVDFPAPQGGSARNSGSPPCGTWRHQTPSTTIASTSTR